MQAISVSFVSLAEGIDATTPAGKHQMHILGAIAEFEHERIRERVVAGLRRARTQGKRLGRPRRRPALLDVPGGTVGQRREPRASPKQLPPSGTSGGAPTIETL